jgi:hypothetical protein
MRRNKAMKTEGIVKNVVFSALGLAILIAGLVMLKTAPDAQGILLTLPYICIGIGSGIFGGSLATAIEKYMIKKDPNLAREIEIESKDERNIAIRNKAKAKAYDLMQIVFGVLIIAFALTGVDMRAVLSSVAAYLFTVLSVVYYLNKYNKEM